MSREDANAFPLIVALLMLAAILGYSIANPPPAPHTPAERTPDAP